MKALFKRRLLKLAEHLERGKLIHAVFDFSVLNVTCSDLEQWNSFKKDNCGYPLGVTSYPPHKCGTLGCALGEMPAVSKKWNFSKESEPHLKGSRKGSFDSAEGWFGLEEQEAAHLFAPGEQEPKYYGGDLLGRNATAKQVAANIRAFIKKKEKDDARK